MKSLVVIPTYNEAQNLPLLVDKIRAVDGDISILIVDDHSPDGTGEIADRLAVTLKNFYVCHRAGKLGIGSAHIAGIRFGKEKGYDFAITMDCDFTHRPEFLPDLIREIKDQNLDLVIGSRYLRADGITTWPFVRRAITRTAHFVTWFFVGLEYDATNGLRIYRLSRFPFDQLFRLKTSGYAFMVEMLFICKYSGAKIGEIPVDLPVRNFGVSKISKKEIFIAIYRMFLLTLARLSYAFGDLLKKKPCEPALHPKDR